MKDNIEARDIQSRKIIIQIIFKPKPEFLDLRGKVLKELFENCAFKASDWSIRDTSVHLMDKEAADQNRNLIQAEIGRLTIMSTNFNSVDQLMSSYFGTYDSFTKIVGDLEVLRIGCRILGVYRPKSADYQKILDGFKSLFTKKVFIDSYPTTDLELSVKYENGNYRIGPVDIADDFAVKNFPTVDRPTVPGFGIDADNYMLHTAGSNLSGRDRIKDVIVASLAVEKSLVEELKQF